MCKGLNPLCKYQSNVHISNILPCICDYLVGLSA